MERKNERSIFRNAGSRTGRPIEKLLIRVTRRGREREILAREEASGQRARQSSEYEIGGPIFKRGDPLVTKYPLILFKHVQRPRFGKSPYKSQPCLSAL